MKNICITFVFNQFRFEWYGRNCFFCHSSRLFGCLQKACNISGCLNCKMGKKTKQASTPYSKCNVFCEMNSCRVCLVVRSYGIFAFAMCALTVQHFDRKCGSVLYSNPFPLNHFNFFRCFCCYCCYIAISSIFLLLRFFSCVIFVREYMACHNSSPCLIPIFLKIPLNSRHLNWT